MAAINPTAHVPSPRHATESPDLNFVLFLLGGLPIQKRTEFMRERFPRTMLLLECRDWFVKGVSRRSRKSSAGSDDD